MCVLLGREGGDRTEILNKVTREGLPEKATSELKEREMGADSEKEKWNKSCRFWRKKIPDRRNKSKGLEGKGHLLFSRAM